MELSEGVLSFCNSGYGTRVPACVNLDVSVKLQKIETCILGIDALWLKIQGYTVAMCTVTYTVNEEIECVVCCTKEVAGNSVVMTLTDMTRGLGFDSSVSQLG
jgi:hypothetical protein